MLKVSNCKRNNAFYFRPRPGGLPHPKQALKKLMRIKIGFYANINERPILIETGLIFNNKIKE